MVVSCSGRKGREEVFRQPGLSRDSFPFTQFIGRRRTREGKSLN